MLSPKLDTSHREMSANRRATVLTAAHLSRRFALQLFTFYSQTY
jgi:hypothetical protein